MKQNKIMESRWDPEKKLLVTHISGEVNEADVEKWEETLLRELDRIPSNSQFRIFVNLYGFTAENFEAHKRFRTIIPVTLAQYGWKTGYTGLFEEDAAQMQITVTRGIHCIAAAHCHHDATKMELYETRFSHETEHYFTDPGKALIWIGQVGQFMNG